MSLLFTLAPGVECKGNAFGVVCLFFCPRVTKKTIASIDLIFYTRTNIPVVRSSKIIHIMDMDSSIH